MMSPLEVWWREWAERKYQQPSATSAVGIKWKTSLICYSTLVSRIFLLTCLIILGKSSFNVWCSTQNFLFTVLDNTTPLWVCIFRHFTHLASLGIFYKCQKIVMWAWSYVWSFILALLICSSRLQLDSFCRVLQKYPHTTASPCRCIIFRNFSVTNRDCSPNTHWSGSHLELLSSQRIQTWYLKPFFMKLLQESITHPLIPWDHILMKLLIPYCWSGK